MSKHAEECCDAADDGSYDSDSEKQFALGRERFKELSRILKELRAHIMKVHDDIDAGSPEFLLKNSKKFEEYLMQDITKLDSLDVQNSDSLKDRRRIAIQVAQKCLEILDIKMKALSNA